MDRQKLFFEIKTPYLYLNTLESTSDVICIQEHWQYEFQKDSLASILPNMDMRIICSDTFEEISNFNLPRGKGGIAVVWKRELSPSVQELSGGNNRVTGIEIKTPRNICIICVYMPTNNSGDSYLEYTECLDIISSYLSLYSATHRIIIAGYLNGTLLQPRSYNKHDKLLQAFVQELKLKHIQSDKPSFYHHSGISSSQIDYIIYNAENDFIYDYKVHEKCPINTSSHVPVTAKIRIKFNPGSQISKANSVRRYKLQWDKLDIETFHTVIADEIAKYKLEDKTTEENINFLCSCLKRATATAVPSKMID